MIGILTTNMLEVSKPEI